MNWEIFWAIITFVFGLIVGSFLNSIIYRLDDLGTIIRHRSHCPHCKKEIRWYDLVPLLSFVVLEGKCRECGKKISWQYPLVEICTALLFLAIYLNFGLTYYTLFLLIISCFLIVIFVYDWRKMIIPDIAIIPAIGIWIIIWLLSIIPGVTLGLPVDFLNYLLGGLAGAGFIGLIVLLTRGKGMGVGDIKLAFLLGFICGWPLAVIGLFSAFIIGSIIGLILLAAKIKKLKSAIPFGPFLIVGFYIALFWGEKIIGWYIK